jgi:RNA polymerase sigma-70 factor (ECF subfamily)
MNNEKGGVSVGRSRARILDEYLASAARAGDRAAFGQLAERWHPKLLAHAWRLTGDVELSRDIAQDGWADISKGLSRLNDSAAFPAWAFRIVTRRAADAIRKKQRQRKIDEAYTNENTGRVIDASELEMNAERHALQSAMAQLPPDQRAAIALFYAQDLSVAEVAAALEVPAGTVKTRLMHARRKLRATLERGGEYG